MDCFLILLEEGAPLYGRGLWVKEIVIAVYQAALGLKQVFNLESTTISFHLNCEMSKVKTRRLHSYLKV